MHALPQLPLDTWIVIQYPATAAITLVSRHGTQGEAEAERDRRNGQAQVVRYAACKVVEVVAERMGGRCHCAVGVGASEARQSPFPVRSRGGPLK